MLKKQYIIVPILFFLIIALVFSLYLISVDNNEGRNGFTRQFRNNFVIAENALDIRYNSYYIAGLSSSRIYLGNYTNPVHILVTSYALADTQHVAIDIPEGFRIAWSSLHTTIYPPNIYVNEGVSPTFLQGTVNNFKMSIQILDSIKFNASVQLSPSSVVLRTYNRQLYQNILTKVTLDSSNVKRTDYIPEKQMDGIFSLDGKFLYDPDAARIVYLYIYRNQFLYFDTDLNLIYEGNTIDTISTAQIKVDTIVSEGKTTMSAPPLKVNLKGAITSDWLFVNSGLMADNEKQDLFKRMSVIDIYSLESGHYQFSFYLPKYKGNKLRDFKVFSDKLVAIYDQYLVVYDLDTKYLEDSEETMRMKSK